MFTSISVTAAATCLGRVLCFLGVWVCLCNAQFPSFTLNDESVTIVQSPINKNITISFKSPPFGTCTTVFQTQKQFTGYVHLPPNILAPSQGNYSINTFFWFIEARQLPEKAPLTVFINGGPGSSSMVGLFQELGPCKVVEVDQETMGTVARDWGWDRSSNILFVDQPAQVGFSYDVLTNKSLNLLDELFSPVDDTPVTQPPYTFLNGTFGSGQRSSSANTSAIAAQSMWHFLQGFLATFPEYNPAVRTAGNDSGAVGINLFTESYGGRFGPVMAAFFEEQNKLREADQAMANVTLPIELTSLGIMNGWVDLNTQMPFFPRFAYSNSYDIQTITLVQQLNALNAWSGAGGCQELTNSCRSSQAVQDPDNNGNVATVNKACEAAQTYCQNNVIGPYTTSGRSIYDISQNLLDPFPDSLYLDYLNQADVQAAIGVPVNYTQNSFTVNDAFVATGDYARDGTLQDLAQLAQSGVRVALIYGDRDYICNWRGGEAISFAIAGTLGRPYSEWYSAGYAPIVTNDSFIGGVVREFGNLSFSRVYDAGHLVPAYQPETAFTIFSRIIEGTSVSLGQPIDRSSYTSNGEANSTHTNSAPSAASPTCYLRAINSTCDTDQKNMIANKVGVIINGVLYDDAKSWSTPLASISSLAGRPTAPPASALVSAPPPNSSSSSSSGSGGRSSTTSIPTGVFTATGVPTKTSSSLAIPTGPGGQMLLRFDHGLGLFVALSLVGSSVII